LSLSYSSGMSANKTKMTKDALRIASLPIWAVYPDAAIRGGLHVGCNEGRRKLVARAYGGGVVRELVYDLSKFDSVRITSFGKASTAVALAAAEVLSDPPSWSSWIFQLQNFDGVVIIKDDHATEEEIKTLHEKYNILIRSGSRCSIHCGGDQGT
jgi:hypothetical protein